MEKEERIVVVLLCMAFLSLTIAYATFFCGDGGSVVAGGFSSSSLPGEKVRFEGDVLSKRFTYSGGHLLMDVDYGSGIVRIFVPSDNGANDIDSQINEKDHVLVLGTVDEYEGELEVVVQSSADIVLSV